MKDVGHELLNRCLEIIGFEHRREPVSAMGAKNDIKKGANHCRLGERNGIFDAYFCVAAIYNAVGFTERAGKE